MHLHRLAGDPDRHLVDSDLGGGGEERDRGTGRRWRRRGTAGSRAASMSRYISASFQRMPWKSAIGLPKTVRSRTYLTASSKAPSARPSEIDGLRQRCVLKAVEQFAEAVLAQHQVLQRQFDILEADLVQVLAAHRVIGAGHRKARRAALDQHAADALAARLAVDAGEDDEHAGLLGPADQRLDAVQPQPVADTIDIGLVVRDIGAGIAARSCRSPGCTRRCTTAGRMRCLIALRRIGRR